MKPIFFITLSAMLLILGGCSSPWESYYSGAPIGHYEPVEHARVRDVQWQRIDDALYEIGIQRSSVDVHFDDWTREEKLAEQAVLLRGLQVSQSPRDVIVIGRSMFFTTDNLSPDDGFLEEFASSIGADLAIWSAHYVGKADKVIHERVYEHGFEFRSYRDSSGNHRHRYEPWHRTVYVPVVVQADEYAWMVYYLRLK